MMYSINSFQINFRSLWLCLGLAVMLVNPVNAQIEEVVVTAQKREQSASDVGIAMAVLSGNTMKEMGMERSEDIVNFMPNIEITSIFGPGTNPNYAIRGVTQNDYNDATESPNALYVDDVYLVATGAGSFPLFDLKRAEVLRGPQGTTFGRNATGGVLHFISNEPTDEFSASLTAGYGSHNTTRVQGHINGALNDQFQVRLAGYWQDNDGYYDHTTGAQPDGGEIQSIAFRGQIAWEPTSTIRNVVKFNYAESHGHSSTVWHDAIGTDPVTGDFFTLPEGTLDGAGRTPIKGLNAENDTFRALKGAESFLVINKLDWEVADNITLTSITGYNDYERDVVEDCDGGPQWLCSTHYNNPSHQFTQELRAFLDFGSQRYTVGAYYLEQDITINQIAPLFIDFGGGGIVLDVDGRQESDGWALFGNGEFDFGEQFTFIAGLRVSEDNKHFQDFCYCIYGPVDPANPWPNYVDTTEVPTGALIAADRFNDANSGGENKLSKFSWNAKAQLDWKPNDDSLYYLGFSRGTKAPGYNHGFIAGGLPISDYKYKQEILTSYEVGTKLSLWDGRAQLNAAGFYYDYSKYQVLTYIGIGSLIGNNDAWIYGGEFDLIVQPDEHWTFSVNGSVIDHKVKDVSNASGIVADREAPIAPKWTVAARVTYEDQVSDTLMGGVSVDGRARDSFFNDPQNNTTAKVHSMGIMNARVFLTPTDNKWTASVSVNNMFDRRYVKSIFPLVGIAGFRYGFYGQPRWVMGEVSYNF